MYSTHDAQISRLCQYAPRVCTYFDTRSVSRGPHRRGTTPSVLDPTRAPPPHSRRGKVLQRVPLLQRAAKLHDTDGGSHRHREGRNVRVRPHVRRASEVRGARAPHAMCCFVLLFLLGLGTRVASFVSHRRVFLAGRAEEEHVAASAPGTGQVLAAARLGAHCQVSTLARGELWCVAPPLSLGHGQLPLFVIRKLVSRCAAARTRDVPCSRKTGHVCGRAAICRSRASCHILLLLHDLRCLLSHESYCYVGNLRTRPPPSMG